jgi:parvulin-like peptidyl-prolyl isomerase
VAVGIRDQTPIAAGPAVGGRGGLFVVLVAALVMPGTSVGQAPPSAAASPPVARVGDVVITRASLDAVVRRVNPSMPSAGEQRRQVEAAVLEQLIDEQVLRSELAAQLIQVSDSEVDAGIERLRSQLAARGGTFEALLAESGRNEAGVREQIALEISLDKYVRPRVTAQAIEATFEKNHREFDGTRLRVSHVLFRPIRTDEDGIERLVQEAEMLRREMLQGRLTFEDAARGHSAAPSRHRGGDIGWIGRDGPMADAFSKPVFGLAKGEVSKPFVSPSGIHVAKVTDVQPGRVGLDAVRPRIEKLLVTSLIRELVTKGRQATAVDYVPGTAHFDPNTPADGPQPRRVVVEGEAAAK